MADKIPVTVLTGFLGAGKTTLLNRILTENHGKKYAVIVNEFGQEGIDGDLIVDADEEIFEMNNGCICCTVRGDLIRILGGLLKRKGKLDGVLVETTGLADPAPVAQTFFADEDLAERTRLDAIVTVADARHLDQQLAASEKAAEQLALADVILLNKIDLVDGPALAAAERRIRAMNPTARLIRTTRGDAPLERLLGLGAFDLERVLAAEPDFLTKDHSHEHGDHAHDHGHDAHEEACDVCGAHGHDHHHHDHDHHDHDHDHQDHVHAGPGGHAHDDGIASVSLSSERPIDPDKFQKWFQELLAERGGDILRSKGVLSFADEPERYVVHGVHMMIDGGFLGPWPAGAPRRSRLVFIGRALETMKLAEGFRACEAA